MVRIASLEPEYVDNHKYGCIYFPETGEIGLLSHSLSGSIEDIVENSGDVSNISVNGKPLTSAMFDAQGDYYGGQQ